MLASTWLDLVVGVDIHFEMVPTPAGPIPTPFPNPFIGMVFDPAGLAVGLALGAAMALATGGTPTGPVLINCMPATNVGTEAKGMGHILIPPGVSWVPMPKFPKPSFRGPPEFPGLPVKPEDDAVSIMGSTTVSIMGSSAVRMGELWMSCGEPLRLPSSVVIAIPKGPLVLVGGPPGVNLMDALLAMIKTKWVAGYLHSLISRIKSDRLRNVLSKAVCFLTGHPVDVATGRLLTDNVDFELPGPIPLKFERNYASSWSHRHGPLGPGWSHSLDQAVWFERGKVVYLAEDGREIEFDTFDLPDHSLRPGQEVYDPINQLTLRFKRSDSIEIETHEGEVLEFAAPKARYGNARDGWWRLQKRRNPERHEIALSYDDRGNLAWVKDSAGRILMFEHDAANRLTCVRLPHPSQDAAIEYMRYGYDAEGDLVQATDALGGTWTFAYKRHLMVRETNRNGLSFYFAYDGWGADAHCVRTWGDGGIYDHVIDYSKGQLTVVTNSLGHQTAYKLNPLGLVVEVLDARGGSTKFEYDERTLRLTKEIGPDGGETKTDYDARGNIVGITEADGAVVQFQYNAQNLPIRVRNPLGAEWSWTYDAVGRVTGRSNPLGERVQFHWGESGPVAFTDPLGQHTQLTYDGAGNLSSLTTPDAGTTRWSYDRLGRVVSATDANGNTFRRERDLLGRTLRSDEPDGNRRELQYDPEGNLLRARDKMYEVAFEYRGMHRLAARAQAGTRVEFDYNTEERLTTIRNENGCVYRFQLDPLGEVEEELGFDGLRRRYLRDASGRITRVLLPGARSTTYGYDRAGRIVAIRYSDGTEESFAYRADGALMAAHNSSAKLSFERDPLGRITKESSGEDWVSSEYDALGLRRSVRSSKGLFQRVRRSSVGDVLALEASIQDAQPRSSGSAPGAGEFGVSFQRDKLGLEIERSLPGGIQARWQRDSLGRPLRHEVFRGTQFQSAKQYTWEVNDRLVRVVDAMRGPVHYSHDGLGNLVAAAHGDGRLDLRMPDAVGNLFRSQDRSDRKYGAAGQLLEARDERGTTIYEYDSAGNLSRKVEPDGSVWTFHFNAAGLLSKVERPNGHAVYFEYDPLARRVAKTYRGKTTRWIWDGNLPLHEWVERAPDAVDESFLKAPREEDALAANENALKALLAGRPANGPPNASATDTRAEGTAASPITWLFEPESFAPVAKLVGDERYSIVTDHLGTPSAMFDAQGKEVWGADIDAYGALRDVRGERQACPFRWPGQYEDEETGLYYNRWRYYDVAGEYISQDPLRLAGGPALYAYAHDPNTWIDPQGLTLDFASLMNMAQNSLDFSTAPNSAVFWATPNMKTAQDWATANGKTTLEQTAGGKYLDSLKLFEAGSPVTPAEAARIWDAASERFAKGASGEVNVFSTGAKRMGPWGERTWWRLEKPTLKKNLKVTKITRRKKDGTPCK